MNTLEIYFERGVEKGIEKGKEQIVQNLINTGKFTLPEIANLAGVPESFVKKVHTPMKKKN
jgi:phage portal protein BeeE